jgi:hypothetical protein
VSSLLAASAFAELVVHRLLGGSLRSDPLRPRPGIVHHAETLGLFLFEFTAILSVLMLAAQLLRIAVGAGHYRIGARVSFALIGGVCAVLAALGVFLHLPADLLFHLHLSFVFFGLLVVVAIAGSPTRSPVKLGVFALWLTAALHLGAAIKGRLALPGTEGTGAAQLEAAAEWGFLAVALLSPILFGPFRRRIDRAALFSASLVAVGGLTVAALDWDAAARIVGTTVGVELPIAPWGWVPVVLALAALTYTVLAGFTARGVDQLRGQGLLLLGVVGLRLDAPAHVACASVGLLCLAESSLRLPEGRLPRADFDALLRRVASALGALHVTLTGPEGAEVARMTAPAADGPAVEIVLTRLAGAVAKLVICVGHTPPREPLFTLERIDAGKLGPRARGPRIETADAGFDRLFRVHDGRALAGPLLDEGVRTQIGQLVRGWLGVWPAQGLEYRAHPPASATRLSSSDADIEATLVALAHLLRELHRRTS